MHAPAFILVPLLIASSGAGARAHTSVDLETLVAMGGGPVGTTALYFAPNTLKGANQDLNNALSSLGSSANSMGAAFSSGAGSVMDMTTNRLNAIRQALANGLANNEEILIRVRDLLDNPQQLCEALGNQAANAYKMASKGAIAAANTSPASLFGMFGKK